jgi:SSS family solute:Na+ symporter
MASGLVSTLFWEFFFVQSTGINSALISVPIAFIVLFAVTLLTKGQHNEMKEVPENG